MTDPNEPPTERRGVEDDRLAALVDGNAAFALDLHEHLAADAGGNLFFSPYSVSLALAMAYAGARGETEAQMRETLRYTLGQEVHPAFEALQAELERRETGAHPTLAESVEAFRLAVVNALWARADDTFTDEFVALVENHYGSGLHRADFVGDPDGERERINEWIASQTEDRIDELLGPNAITPETILVLTNACYFTARWADQFDRDTTTEGTFRALDGTESSVPMMHQHLTTTYADVRGCEAVELPYVGEEVSMVLLLPDEGSFETFERDLDAETLFAVFEALEVASGDIALPRFEYEMSLLLGQTLSSLGMPTAFEAGADFGGMGDGDHLLDEVYHQAYVSVDEEGTEAAAATAVADVEALPTTPFSLTFDRPFLFCIRDRPTDALLFLGRVVDAGEAQG